MTPEDLRAALTARLDPGGTRWLEEALAAVRADPAAVRTRFPAAGRKVGREPIAPSEPGDPAPWTADDAARALLLVALGDHVSAELPDLHRFGDADEQRAIVRSLHLLPPVEGARELVLEASRTNDPRLIRVALAPYGLKALEDGEVAQIALKCVFTGVPLSCVRGLEDRATPELARMLAGFALERIAAGRSVPADVWPFIDRHPPRDLLDAIEEERAHRVAERREAAAAALADRRASREAR